MAKCPWGLITRWAWVTKNEPLLRDERNEPYEDKKCQKYLESLGVFMGADKIGISKESAADVEKLLEKKCKLPGWGGGKFSKSHFADTCEKLVDEDDDAIRDILGELIVPGMKRDIGDLSHLGFPNFGVTQEGETWGDAVPIDSSKDKRLPIPQPDFSVGYKKRVFSDAQYTKLTAALGREDQTSPARVTSEGIHFPFLTAEINNKDLRIAELASTHSMAVAVRGVVELFKLTSREKELNGQILAFSVNYTESHVTIYGHYPVINGENVRYYRHLIKEFDFQADDGKERWTAYRFVNAVYSDWAPEHQKRICWVLGQLVVDDEAINSVERRKAIHKFRKIIRKNPSKGMMGHLERTLIENVLAKKAGQKPVDRKKVDNGGVRKKKVTKK
ncbi:hypothetical protein BJY04DRAFT_70563 [Aspergillus karnatakaensis]|uniref:uncharacterized protein n=1 Tax=Aspergillus karnatakaensis TaxID=1810916 RepID=UPI003CCD3596